MSWYDPDEPLISFEITAHIDDLTKAQRKKLFKLIDNAMDNEDTQTYDITLSKGNKVATIEGVTDMDTFEDVLYILRKQDVDYEKSCDRASDWYNNPDGGMGWRDTSWD